MSNEWCPSCVYRDVDETPCLECGETYGLPFYKKDKKRLKELNDFDKNIRV